MLTAAVSYPAGGSPLLLTGGGMAPSEVSCLAGEDSVAPVGLLTFVE